MPSEFIDELANHIKLELKGKEDYSDKRAEIDLKRKKYIFDNYGRGAVYKSENIKVVMFYEGQDERVIGYWWTYAPVWIRMTFLSLQTIWWKIIQPIRIVLGIGFYRDVTGLYLLWGNRYGYTTRSSRGVIFKFPRLRMPYFITKIIYKIKRNKEMCLTCNVLYHSKEHSWKIHKKIVSIKTKYEKS